MEYPNPAYTSFTIPTGATSGARITFNELGDGTIRIYNSSGTLTDILGGNFGAITVFGGYAGNMDTQLVGGQIEFGIAPGFNNPARIFGQTVLPGVFVFDSGTNGAVNSDNCMMSLNFGLKNQTTGSANAPYLNLDDGNASSATDLHLSGSVIKTDLLNNLYTWQVPSYAANWSDGTVASGLGGDGLRYRFMAENDLWFSGLATAAAGAGTTIFTLPVAYRPASGTPHGQVLRDRGGVTAIVEVAVFLGQVILGAPVNAGDTYSFNFRIPLHNVA